MKNQRSAASAFGMAFGAIVVTIAAVIALLGASVVVVGLIWLLNQIIGAL